MAYTPVREVEVEAYRRAQDSLAGMLDRLVGSPPVSIAIALYEQQPPSVLSRHDPVLGRYASMLIDARGAAGHDYYIPKIAQITARTIGMACGHDSAEFRRAMTIIRRARHNRAGKVRPAALARAQKRVARRRARRGVADSRTLAAAQRLRRLTLRAGLDDDADQQFEAMVEDIQRDGSDQVATIGVEFMTFANDYAEVGELDRAVATAERARRWVGARGLPAAADTEHLMMNLDLMSFEHCRAAGLAQRCAEITATMVERLTAHRDPEFAEDYARAVHEAGGRVALLRHDYRAAVSRLRQALDDPDPDGLAFVTRGIRDDLLFALAADPDTPTPGATR